MKTFQKLFAAMFLVAVIGVIGCADPKKTETPAKPTEASNHAEAPKASHDEGKTKPAPAEDAKTEPMKTEPKVEADDPKEPADPGNAESGSTENKGGVKIPE